MERTVIFYNKLIDSMEGSLILEIDDMHKDIKEDIRLLKEVIKSHACQYHKECKYYKEDSFVCNGSVEKQKQCYLFKRRK